MPTQYTMSLDDAALKEVEELRAVYALENKAKVYELAIRVLAWATDQKMRGFEVGRYEPEAGVFRQLQIPQG